MYHNSDYSTFTNGPLSHLYKALTLPNAKVWGYMIGLSGDDGVFIRDYIDIHMSLFEIAYMVDVWELLKDHFFLHPNGVAVLIRGRAI